MFLNDKIKFPQKQDFSTIKTIERVVLFYSFKFFCGRQTYQIIVFIMIVSAIVDRHTPRATIRENKLRFKYCQAYCIDTDICSLFIVDQELLI